MTKNNLKQAGMSLVEVMIGVGIAAGIGLIMMRNQDNANKMQAKVVANQDINSAVNIIQTQLANRAICSMSLAGKKPGSSIPTDSEVTALFDATTNPEFDGSPTKPEFILKTPPKKHVESGTLLPGKKVRLESMKLVTSADDKDYLEAVFNVNPDGKLKAYGGQELKRRFPILAVKNMNGEITSCYSESSNLVNTAVKDACTSLGATWDTSETPPKCKLTNLPQCVVTPSACSGLYSVQKATYQMFENYQETKRIFKSRYHPDCLHVGGSHDERCTCYGTDCTCDTGSKKCYKRDPINQLEQQTNVTRQRNAISNQCCKP